ncbi:MAG: PAS domain S-box protein [Pyrinomonadaceae bacterium]
MNKLDNPATVLIVKADQVQFNLWRDLLEPEGYEVLLAESGQRALEIVRTRRIDIIISDVVMPGMNGTDLCRHLKTDPRTATIPLLLTGGNRNEEETPLLEGSSHASADDYLDIPFRYQELLVKVARLTERHRVERRYRDIVEQAADIIYTRDMDGVIRSINDAGARFFGRPAFELIGTPISLLIGEDAAGRDIAQMKSIKSFEPIRFTDCLKNALGEERYLEGIITIERDAQDESVGVRGVVRDVTDRRIAERTLRKQNEEYRLLFEANPCPMYVVDEGTLAFLAVNESAVSHYGYSREEFLNMHAQDIRPVDDIPALLSYLGEHREGHDAAGVWKHRKKDGTLIEVEVNWHRLDFAGRPAYLVMANDITDQKRAQAAVIESEERYRELFENANDIIYTIDLAGNFTSLNQTGARLTGYSVAEALKMNIARVVAPEHLENVRQNLARKLESNEVSTVYQTEILTKSGERLPLELSSRVICRGGQPVGVQGTARDIRARKAAEDALKDSEEKFRSIVETTNEWIWAIDVRQNCTYTNPAIQQILGYRSEEIVGVNVLTLLDTDDRAEFLSLLPKLVNERRGWTGRVLRWRHKHGGYRYLESNALPVFDSQDKLIGFRGADRDITERRRMELEREAIFEIVQGVITTPTLDALLELVHRSISKVLYAKNCFVALYDPPTNLLHFELWVDENDPPPAPRPVGRKGFANYVLRSGKPLLLTRTLTDKMIARGDVEASGTTSASWLGVPLRTESRSLGVLVVQHYEDEHAYTEQDLELLTSIGSQTALAIEQKRAESEIQQQAERVAVTNRISQAVRRTLDVSVVFETAVRELGQHLEVDRCSLYMKDEKAGRVTNAAEFHVPDVEPAGSDFELPPLKGLTESMEKHGVMAFDDVAGDERSRGLYEGVVKRDVKSIMYVGVTVGQELLGAFALSTTKALRHWSDADIEVARSAADQTGVAIRQARLYQQAEATSMREALVNKLSVAIRASLSLDDVLDTATRELGQALGASRVRVRLYDESGDQSSAHREYRANGLKYVGKESEQFAGALRAYLLKSAKPLIVDDARKYSDSDEDFAQNLRSVAESSGVQSQIGYPLIVNEEFRGIISIHQTDRLRRWTEDEVLLVESVAAQLATGIAQAELFEMVAHAKQQWESTFDAMSDGIFIFDREGCLVRVNRAGAAMEQTPPESLLGRKCCDILRTDNGTSCIVEQAVRQSKSINVEIVPVHLDRPMLVTVESVLDERSQTVGAVCTARDLSELRKVEAVARERQSLLQNIMESAREAIYALDSEGRYKWCNHAMLEMTGYKLDDIIGHSFLERTHEEDRQMRRERFVQALKGEAQSFESRYVARDGSTRFAAVNSAPIIVDGQTTGVLGIAHDITEQKQERDRAARADKLRALGQLASGVAHDFNNSLAAILGRAQLILRRVKDEELIRSLGIIVTAAEDAASTVRRIQTFARKSVVTEFELLDVGNLLRDAIEITRTRWQNEAQAAGLNIEVVLDAEHQSFTAGNASELREVFVNLIVNAVDAMPRGGSLSISCKRKGDRIKLRLADTGTGMKEEVRERIFEPFYTTKGVQGTGLGLAVSYGIIERHQGMISVESQPGKGTIFHIDLPFADNQEQSKPRVETISATRSLSILVIDDEEFVRETLAEMLVDLDHRVQTVASGRAALTKLAAEDFNVVFTDLAMPEMDGWETARAIRQQNPNLPVILVTGYGATARPPSGEHDLVTAIIGKPFDFDQVASALANVAHPLETSIEDPVLAAQ